MGVVQSQGECISKKCNSHDAGTWYTDGSFYCFSCGYYKPPNGVIAYKHRDIVKYVSVVRLPEDTVSYIPQIAMDWLNKYNLTEEETHNFLWSSVEEKLVYPVLVNGDLIFYWSRYFPQRAPKNYSQGNLEFSPHILTHSSECDTLYIVEDIVSAIKVNRTSDVLCLFGSSIRDSWIRHIKQQGYKKVVIWLDYDKRISSLKSRSRLHSLLGCVVESKITELDPKEHIK